jgi:long-chain acyl-CoA synthetase
MPNGLARLDPVIGVDTVIRDMTRAQPPATTMASFCERSYVNFANSLAVVTDHLSLTYAELGVTVHGLIDGIHGLGVSPGEPVVILLENCPEFIIADHACFVGGFIRVALTTRSSLAEVVNVLEDCRPGAVITSGEWIDRLVEVEAVRELDIRYLATTPSPHADAVLRQFLETGGPFEPREISRVSPLSPASISYTSGTTGRPKGVMLTHANWVAMARNLLTCLPNLGTTDVVAHFAPLSHASGYYAPIFVANGCCQIPFARFVPAAALAAIESHRVSALPMVPTMLNRLVESAEDGDYDLSALRMVMYGASPIAPDRIRRAVRVFGERLFQFYGSSEAPMPLTCLSPVDHKLDDSGTIPERLQSAGRVVPFVDLKLVDESGTEVPVGEVGEVVVRSDTIMLGYLHLPERTTEVRDADGWMKTGDLGRLSSDGYLTIVDRKNDLIISGGFNVYPNEVEIVIMGLAGVQEVAVVGIPDEVWGETVVAVVVRRPDHEVSEDEVVQACAANLAGYKKPRRVEFVSELPKTSSGKILRRRALDAVVSPSRGLV